MKLTQSVIKDIKSLKDKISLTTLQHIIMWNSYFDEVCTIKLKFLINFIKIYKVRLEKGECTNENFAKFFIVEVLSDFTTFQVIHCIIAYN